MHVTDTDRTRYLTLLSSNRPRSAGTWTLSHSLLPPPHPHYKVRSVTSSSRINTLITIIGQLAASLASLSRTVDDYSALSKKELIPEKQQKAFDRIKNFRDELTDYRAQFDRLRKEREDAVSQSTSHPTPQV